MQMTAERFYGDWDVTMANQITTANAGWRTQFRFRGPRHRPGVAEFYRWPPLTIGTYLRLRPV